MKDLAQTPRWPAERTLALPGRVRGDALGNWGENLKRRFGSDAVDRIRARVSPETAKVAPKLGAKDSIAIFSQIEITEAVVDLFFDGDIVGIEPMLVEDTRRAIGTVGVLFLRGVGPKRVLEHAATGYSMFYDQGKVEVEAQRRSGRIIYRDAAHMDNPTWRVLQVFAQRTLYALGGTEAGVTTAEVGPQAFAIDLSW